MPVPRRDILPISLAFAGVVAWVWSAQYDPFFWDTVQLASKHAHFFFENGLQWAVLPPEIDSGHPPVFGFYLAFVWSVFGKTLPASHWAMLPFLLGIVWFLYRLGGRLAGPDRAFWLLPLVLLDPVVAGQSVLVSPDIALLCFFLMTTEGVFTRKPILVCIGALALCALSMRGMMTAAALFAWDAALRLWPFFAKNNLYPHPPDKKSRPWSAFFFQITPVYLPGFVFAALFLLWHQRETGWTGFHPGSPWAPAFERATSSIFLKNIAVLGWRWLDFGRVFEWLLALALLYFFWKKRGASPAPALLLLWIILLLFLSPSALFYQNLSAHRYFLPGFIAFHLFIFHWLFARTPGLPGFQNLTGLAARALILLFALGNGWIYPRGISMGWDATLAHLPYHRLQADALDWLERNNIDLQNVGTAFPNLNTGEDLMLSGDQRRMEAMDFSKNKLIFASNVFNDISQADYSVLARSWALVWRKKHAGVWIEIYAKRVD